MFKPLENSKVRILQSESLLPWWIFRIPTINGWLVSLKTMPIRNWIFQQILKLSISDLTEAEIIQFVDSDVTLLRPFDPAYLVRGDLVRLQHTQFAGPDHARWLDIARAILGLSEDVALSGNYVGNFITWRRSNLIAMKQFITERTGRSWIRTVASRIRFSEYMLYGIFADHVLGRDQSGHFHDDSPNLALCWDYDLHTEEGMARFFDSLTPEDFGIMIHSKYNIPFESYRSKVEQLWQRWD